VRFAYGIFPHRSLQKAMMIAAGSMIAELSIHTSEGAMLPGTASFIAPDLELP